MYHWAFTVLSKGLSLFKKKIPSSLQQEVVHLVWELLGLLVAVLASFSFQPENPK
jgi:hypothetical protein